MINSAYNKLQFWDGRAPSLEKQAEGPVQNPVEMGHTLSGVEKRLMASAKYREEFKNAWGTDQITYEMVEKSIASFERTVLSGDRRSTASITAMIRRRSRRRRNAG